MLKKSKPDDTRSYFRQLANWQAKNTLKAEHIYKTYVCRIDDRQSPDDDGEILDAFEMIADTAAQMPETRLVELETTQEVEDLIHNLSPVDARIARMVMAGIKYEVIARELQTTGNNISQRIRRMRGAFLAFGLTPSALL